jgi:hypothetical protein
MSVLSFPVPGAVRVSVVALAMTSMLAAGRGTDSTTTSAGSRTSSAAGGPGAAATLCPAVLQELVDTRTPAGVEYDLAVDMSGSFIGSPPALERTRAQVAAVVQRAVDHGAALHVLSFTGSVATGVDAAACPTMRVRYHNEEARTSRTHHPKEIATDAIWAGVLARRPAPSKAGTSVVGGWQALSESQPLAGDRKAIMLSDGRGRPEDIPVDLSMFASVGMYSVGSVAANPSSTADTVALAERWRSWLAQHGAHQLTVSTQAYR